MEYDGLGLRFREEIWKDIKRITDYPMALSVESREIRKYILHKFPYKNLSSIETDHILIIAVAHQRRETYWTVMKQIGSTRSIAELLHSYGITAERI